MPDMIDLLQSRMGFITNIQLAPANQSYSAVVQPIAKSTYHIVIGDRTVTSARREIVDLLFCLLERDDNGALQDGSLMSLFAMSVWYCFGSISEDFYLRKIFDGCQNYYILKTYRNL